MTVAPASTATPSVAAYRPLLGVAAVVVGAFISTINTRVTTVGLADIRGGLSLGFDEGSWLSTAFGASQMVVCLSAAWFSFVLGPRRILLWSSAIFLVTSALPPLTRDPSLLLALQIVRGLAVGAFIPAAIPFIVRELPPRWWSWGLAAYAFRFAFSQNISSSIEAFYDENGLWEWIFWQNIPLTLMMMGLICLGMRRQPPDLDALRKGDWSGILFAGVGLALLYAGIDQGNRLDWLNSGTIIGLLLAGGLLLVAFVVNELVVERPLIDLKALLDRNVCIPPFMIATLRIRQHGHQLHPARLSRTGSGPSIAADRRRTQLGRPASDRARAVPGLGSALHRCAPAAGRRPGDAGGRQLDGYGVDARLGRRRLPALAAR